jgi:hypothetical protein
MDPGRAAPPAAESCLVLSCASRGQKGGTFIAEAVVDAEAHEAQMKSPGQYRPSECACGGKKLHIHQRRERRLRGSPTRDAGFRTVLVMVFLCVACRATWRVLPAFVTRCLWRAWDVVEGVVHGTRQVGAPVVPSRTRRRWRARSAAAARVPAQVLATAGTSALREVAQAVGLDGDRLALARAYMERFGGSLLRPLASLLHRLAPGIRLI